MPFRCLFCYITDRTALGYDEATRRHRLLEKIADAALAGVDFIQLREKDVPTRELESLAREAVRVISNIRTESPHLRTRLLINSRTDVALATEADGVHLRSDDVSPPEVKQLWSCRGGAGRELSRRNPLIGVSCHSPAEVAQAASDGAGFAVFGPVFDKKDSPTVQPTGLQQLREPCHAGIPVLALGGVTLANAHACLEAGAAGIAAIRLFQENDIVEVVRQLREKN